MAMGRAANPAWIILLAGLCLSLFGSVAVRRDIDGDLAERLEFDAKQLGNRLHDRFDAQALMLRASAPTLRQADPDRRQWRAHVAGLKSEQAMRGLEGVGFARIVPGAELNAHLREIRAEGFPAYNVRPAGRRDFYAPVVLLEPFNDRNKSALGQDMLSEPVLREAMARARDTGRPALSGKVILVHEGETAAQAGTLIYAPVYRSGAAPESVDQRRAALLGWVYSPYRIGDLVNTLLSEWRTDGGRDIRVRIVESPGTRDEQTLFDNIGAASSSGSSPAESNQTFQHGGRSWELSFRSAKPARWDDYAPFWLVLGSGLLLTGLLASLANMLLNRRRRAEELAQDLTRDIRRHEAALVDQEARWRSALEGSHLGVWDWNVREGHVYFSPLWKAMLGFEEDEIGSSLAEWEDRVHPDDLPGAKATVQAALDGEIDNYASEHQVRCKDGSYKWILDRGRVFERAPDGTPLRMVGTHADVDETHKARVRTLRHGHLYAALAACNAAINRRESFRDLAETACRILTSEGHLKLVWAGLHNPETDMIEPLTAAGAGTEYLEGIEISVRDDDPHGQGPSGTAFRESQPVWIDDFANDPRTLPWRERAVRQGWRGSAALPLRRNGAPVAIMAMYADEAGFFDEETRALLNDMAAQFSIALDALDAEQSARESQAAVAASERRYRSVLENAVEGILILGMDGRVLTANKAACEMLGRSEEEIRQLPGGRSFVREDEAYRAFSQSMAGGPAGSGELNFIRADDSTFVVHSSASVYEEEPGLERISVIFEDITKRKADQELLAHQLAELERWYRAMRGREDRIIALKREVNEALAQPRYEFASDEAEAEAVTGPDRAGTSNTGEDGDIRNILLNVIEDQKRAEEKLLESEQRFRSIFEQAPLGIALLDTLDNRFLDINSRYAAIVGWPRDELMARTWQDITHPEDLGPGLVPARAFKAGEISGYSLEKRYVGQDGSTVWVRMTISRLPAPEGERQLHLCMIDDISESRKVAQALVAEEAKFRALSEQSTVGIYMINDDRLSYINPIAAAMFGYPAEEMIGLATIDLIFEADRPRLIALRREREAHPNTPKTAELVALRRDGSTFICHIDSQLTEIDGRPQVVGVLQDITARKRTEQDIREYIERIETMILGTVDAISHMVELRDPYTSGHEKRVGELSVAIAGEMGLDRQVQRGLRLGGAVHDVGKLAVPSEILTKPSRLTPLEFEIIKEHATQGYEVLKTIDSPWPLADMAYQHHERIDGSGYPRGLKGDEILLEARIIAVADVVESMSAHRPYRAALGIEVALAEIERGRGTAYDPAVADACIRLFREKAYKLEDLDG